jgi:hypothetical protein
VSDAQQIMDRWNQKHDVDCWVCVRLDSGEGLLTWTRSHAAVMGGQPVIWLQGIRGAYHLERVTPIPQPHKAPAGKLEYEPFAGDIRQGGVLVAHVMLGMERLAPLFTAAPSLLAGLDQTVSDMQGLANVLDGGDLPTARQMVQAIAARCLDLVCQAKGEALQGGPDQFQAEGWGREGGAL